MPNGMDDMRENINRRMGRAYQLQVSFEEPVTEEDGIADKMELHPIITRLKNKVDQELYDNIVITSRRQMIVQPEITEGGTVSLYMRDIRALEDKINDMDGLPQVESIAVVEAGVGV